MFALDADILNVQPEDLKEFNQIFLQLFAHYVQGDWPKAYEMIEKCIELRSYDGPTVTLREFMALYQYAPPPSWNGVRSIEETTGDADDEDDDELTPIGDNGLPVSFDRAEGGEEGAGGPSRGNDESELEG